MSAIHNYVTTLEEFESIPQRYFQWKAGDDMNLYIYQFDSSFRMVRQNIIDRTLDGHLASHIDPVTGDTLMYYILDQLHFASDNMNSTFVVPDGDDMLIATPYDYDSGFYYDFHECGAVVARYNMNNSQMKAIARFNDQPGPSTDVRIFSFRKNADGDFYMVYREDTPLPEATPTMTAVKMDHDLNVIWKRYCYEPNSFEVDPNFSHYSDKLLDENGNEVGIYIFGTCYRPKIHDNGMFFFFLTEDAPLSVEEQGIIVRPYAYYPNPAHDELHLHYSPDVTPMQIELYDLQGHLLKTQRNGLECLNMESLSSGIYTMRVTLDSGKVFSDKVVKE